MSFVPVGPHALLHVAVERSQRSLPFVNLKLPVQSLTLTPNIGCDFKTKLALDSVGTAKSRKLFEILYLRVHRSRVTLVHATSKWLPFLVFLACRHLNKSTLVTYCVCVCTCVSMFRCRHCSTDLLLFLLFHISSGNTAGLYCAELRRLRAFVPLRKPGAGVLYCSREAVDYSNLPDAGSFTE